MKLISLTKFSELMSADEDMLYEVLRDNGCPFRRIGGKDMLDPGLAFAVLRGAGLVPESSVSRNAPAIGFSGIEEIEAELDEDEDLPEGEEEADDGEADEVAPRKRRRR